MYEKESETQTFTQLFSFFTMAVGRVSLWLLAEFHYGSWPIFTMAVGRFPLWQLAGSLINFSTFFPHTLFIYYGN
jgi:hypothetical protein